MRCKFEDVMRSMDILEVRSRDEDMLNSIMRDMKDLWKDMRTLQMSQKFYFVESPEYGISYVGRSNYFALSKEERQDISNFNASIKKRKSEPEDGDQTLKQLVSTVTNMQQQMARISSGGGGGGA